MSGALGTMRSAPPPPRSMMISGFTGLALQFYLPRLGFRQVENVVDEVQQKRAGGMNVAPYSAGFRGPAQLAALIAQEPPRSLGWVERRGARGSSSPGIRISRDGFLGQDLRAGGIEASLLSLRNVVRARHAAVA